MVNPIQRHTDRVFSFPRLLLMEGRSPSPPDGDLSYLIVE